LSDQTLANIVDIFFSVEELEQAILYGSRAKGNYRPGSDIDLTIKGSRLNQSILFNISEQLKQLALPYEIDLSIYSQINNASLIEHIDRAGIVLYQRSTDSPQIEHSTPDT
jgi:predicted nucleotidyltransferase